MFAGLHIKMAALKTMGDWLDGSGWVQALVQAEMTPGIADSFFHTVHGTQGELTKSLLLHCISCSTIPMTATVREKLQRQMISSSLKTEIPERRRHPSVPVLVTRAGTRAAVAHLCVFPAGRIL